MKQCRQEVGSMTGQMANALVILSKGIVHILTVGTVSPLKKSKVMGRTS